MPEPSSWPIRLAGWAVRCLPKGFLSPIQCLSALTSVVPLLALLCLLLSVVAASHSMAQSADHGQTHALGGQAHHHGHPSAGEDQWEGSRQGVAYSEFNHHLAGVFLLLIGLGEVRQALGWTSLAWTRVLLPGALIVAGIFLLIWSDHDAWPVGSMTFVQTFGGLDPEVLQHKVYGILALAVGSVECLRRVGWSDHAVWAAPLPLFAIVGGADVVRALAWGAPGRSENRAAPCHDGDHGNYCRIVKVDLRLAIPTTHRRAILLGTVVGLPRRRHRVAAVDLL